MLVNLKQASPPDGARITEPYANPVTANLRAVAVAQATGVAARTGIFAQLAEHPTGVAELAKRLGLQSGPLQLLLDVLVDDGLLDFVTPNYQLAAWARRWLDPESPYSVATALSQSLDSWTSWADLDAVITGRQPSLRDEPDDEAFWLRAVRADYELARLAAVELAGAIDLPASARSVLELGSGHGGYAAAFCQRNSELRATVIDQRPIIDIGRELMWERGLELVVTHEVGDPTVAFLGRSHDAVLSLTATSQFASQLSLALVHRVHQALRVGGVFAFVRPRLEAAASSGRALGMGAATALSGVLRSGMPQSSTEQLFGELASVGFGPPRIVRVDALPGLDVYVVAAV
jgi:hypothetical protein